MNYILGDVISHTKFTTFVVFANVIFFKKKNHSCLKEAIKFLTRDGTTGLILCIDFATNSLVNPYFPSILKSVYSFY